MEPKQAQEADSMLHKRFQQPPAVLFHKNVR